jgi:hypothetical protein
VNAPMKFVEPKFCLTIDRTLKSQCLGNMQIENSHYFLLSWNSHQTHSSYFAEFKIGGFAIFLKKKKVYGSLRNNTNYCFLYHWLSHHEKCQKLGMGIFFYFLSFANFFHFSDANLACEHELNNFFFISSAK